MCKGCRQDTEKHTATMDDIQNYLKDMTINTTITDRTVQIKTDSRGFLYLKGPNNINKLPICNKCYHKLSIYLELKDLLTEDEFKTWLLELSSPSVALSSMRYSSPNNREKKIDDLKSRYGRLLSQSNN